MAIDPQTLTLPIELVSKICDVAEERGISITRLLQDLLCEDDKLSWVDEQIEREFKSNK